MGSSGGAAAPERVAALVAQWMLLQPSMVVWDFDLTILRIHAFGDGVTPEAVPDRWQADVADLELFRAFVHATLARGARVAIASYGRSDVIHAYMQQIFADAEEPPFTLANIVTPAALGFPDGT